MRNIQQRVINADARVVGELLDRLATADDPLWPVPAWDPILFDQGLAVGSRGGHGPIRYTVTAYEPGRRIRCDFDSRVGIAGYHELRVEADGLRTRLVHDLVGKSSGAMLVMWPLAVRWLHTALLQELLDNAERASTGALVRPYRYSWWVRVLRRMFEFRPREVRLPDGAVLARAAFAHPDLVDAYSIARVRMPADPQVWADAVFRDPPGWVKALLGVRNGLVRLVGIPPGTSRAFDTLAVAGPELLLGQDDTHLDFRASILVTDSAVIVSTVAKANNRRGKLYLLVVRLFHPPVVRSMLARAARRLAVQSG